MADSPVSIDRGSGTLKIAGFRMQDGEVAEFFASQESSLLEDRLAAVIRTGVMALKSADVGERVDYVKREFGVLKGSLDRIMSESASSMDGYLGENGKVRQALEKYVGEDGTMSRTAGEFAREWAETLRRSMDPKEESSPLHGLRVDIMERLDGIADGLAAREATKEVEKKTPLKGYPFEDYCMRTIDEFAHHNGDSVSDTTRNVGDVKRSKKGDIVVDVGGSARVVIEVKDVGKISEDDARRVLDESIRNRRADFGLMVVKNAEAFGRTRKNFLEFASSDKLAVALGSGVDGDADSAVSDDILLIAYKWARARAIANARGSTEVDAKAISDKIEAVRASVKPLSSVITHAKNIEEEAGKIRDDVKDVIDSTKDALDDVESALRRARAS